VRALANDPREVGETPAPDGKHVAFVADWNLWVAPTDGNSPPRALTTAGNENLLHGRLDWVYQEEVYGRGNFGAFWWSPDSTRLAYLVIDESRVPTYVVTDHRQVHPVNEAWRYPKAGDPNPVATLHVVELGSGKSTPIELGAWSKDEPLIVRVGWTPDATRVLFQIQNRVQTWLELSQGRPGDGRQGAAARLVDQPNDGPWWVENGRRFCGNRSATVLLTCTCTRATASSNGRSRAGLGKSIRSCVSTKRAAKSGSSATART
jgi:dipeptidyl-peptidase-4